MKITSVTIGLTGQTGAGKTTVSEIFAANDFAIINCDIIARTITADGSECNEQLSLIFPECFDKDLSLNRKKLAGIVFNDPSKLLLLNKTIFPYINQKITQKINQLTDAGIKYILLDAPTLFEAGADKHCNIIVSCIADEQIRLERITKRDSISEELARSRIKAQRSDEFYIYHSDYIIKNNGSLLEAVSQTENIIKQIKEKYNG